MNPVGVYYNVDTPAPFRRVAGKIAAGRFRAFRSPVPRVVPVKARKLARARRINPYRPSFGWRGFYDITGTVGQASTGAAVGAPAFVMPYAEPGLGELWGGHLEQQHLEGLLGRVKKVARKIVKSKAFRVVAVAAAAYYGGPMAAKAAAKLLENRAKIKAAIDTYRDIKATTPPEAQISSQQPALPPGFYYDAAGNIHDDMGNVYNRDGTLISAPGAIGGRSEAATPGDPGGSIPGEFPPSALTSSSATPAAGATWPTYGAGTPTGGAQGPALAGIDVSGILKIGIPVALALVVMQAGSSSGGRRRRRRS